MDLYHDASHYQLINVCQDESQKQWINIPPKQDEDLQQFINAHRQVFGVKHHQVLLICLAWVTSMEKNFLIIIQKLYLWTLLVMLIKTNIHYYPLVGKLALVRCLSS